MKKTILLLSFLLCSLVGFSQNYSYEGFPFQYAQDGLMLRNQNTGQIYLVFEGTTRYIPTPATLNGLFDNSHFIIRDVLPSVIGTYPVGTPFSQDSGFIRDTQTQRVYLREGTLLRWIVNIAVSHKYTFNLSIAVNKTGLAGYTVGSDITQ